MDFMMHHHRQSSERSVGSSMEQAARSPCPALRAAAEHGQLPGIFSPNRGPHHYDPFHSNNWRPDNSSYPNPHNPSPHQGWRHHPIPSQSRPLPVAPYPYPDPFHLGTSAGFPSHQDPGNPQLFPMMNVPENQGTQPSLPLPFSYRPSLPSMSSTPHIHHTRNGSQGTDASSRAGSLPALNPNPNPNQTMPSTNTHPSRASLFADLPSPSPRDFIGVPHQLSPLQTGQYPQGPPASILRRGAEPTTRSESTGESRIPQPGISSVYWTYNDGGQDISGLILSLASHSPPPAQTTASPGRNDHSPSSESSSEERRGPSVRTRRATPAVPRMPTSSALSSESSSDEDADAGERSPHGYGFLEFIGPGLGVPEDRIRAQQVLRGTMSAKRVASKSAIASLQSVKISDLPQGDRGKCGMR